MNAEELTHTIRAARNVLLHQGCNIDEKGFGVVGSQSVIGSLLVDTERPSKMSCSAELDIFVLDDDNDWTEYINGALGEESTFHSTYGYYADGIDINIMVFPLNWRNRAVYRLWLLEDKESNAVPVMFMEFHDLIVSKLYAGREKDLNFVASAKYYFQENIERDKILESCYEMPIDKERQKQIIAIFDALSTNCSSCDF